MAEEKKTIRCTLCGEEFTDSEVINAYACLNCGATGIPCHIEDDVTIKINWHELRILGIWADNWIQRCTGDVADESKKVVAAILARIQKQHPKKDPLTLAGEIKQLQQTYPGVTLVRDCGDDNEVEIIVPPKKIQ